MSGSFQNVWGIFLKHKINIKENLILILFEIMGQMRTHLKSYCVLCMLKICYFNKHTLTS